MGLTEFEDGYDYYSLKCNIYEYYDRSIGNWTHLRNLYDDWD